jgi:hypothetical protein
VIDVEIKNFQAIDHLKLNIEGFTALVGRTNIGKSSIVRALKSALSGGSGSDFVRHDARSCARILNGTKSCKCFSSVKLMFAEGQGFLWEKGSKGVNRYTVWKDGVESVYDRVGQSMELPEFLGAQFSPVKLGPTQSLLQVSSQFETPFLLDLSGSVVADILSDIGQLDDINQAMTAVSKDRRSAIATRKVRESDVVTLGRQLETYATLDGHLVKVRALQDQGAKVREVSARLSLADRLLSEAAEGTKAAIRLRTALAPAIPGAKPLRATSERLNQVCGLEEDWQARVGVVTALERVLRPELPDSRRLTTTAERWRKVGSWQAAVVDRERWVERLGKVDQVTPPSAARLRKPFDDLKRLAAWSSAFAKLKVVFERAGRLQKLTVPDTAALTSLAKKVGKADRLFAHQDRLEHELERAERLLAESVEEGRAVLAEFAALGICPTCHQDISPEHAAACPD